MDFRKLEEVTEAVAEKLREEQDRAKKAEKDLLSAKKELEKAAQELERKNKIIEDQRKREKVSKRQRSLEETSSTSIPESKKVNTSCSPRKPLAMSDPEAALGSAMETTPTAGTSAMATRPGASAPNEPTGNAGNVDQGTPVTDYDLLQVSDNVDNLVIESLSSYAEKLKQQPKRPKEVFPYCLFILAGSDGSTRLNKTLWETFLRFTRDENDKIEDEETLFKIEIEFNDYQSGLGILACRNKFTSEWIRSITKNFKSDNQILKPFYRWERDHALVFQGNCRGSDLKRQDVKAHVLLSRCLLRYKLPGEFKNASFKQSKNATGAWLVFEPSPVLARSLEKRKMILYMSGYKVNLEAHYRKKRSEEEFVTYYEQQNKKFKEVFEAEEAKRKAEKEKAEMEALLQGQNENETNNEGK